MRSILGKIASLPASTSAIVQRQHNAARLVASQEARRAFASSGAAASDGEFGVYAGTFIILRGGDEVALPKQAFIHFLTYNKINIPSAFDNDTGLALLQKSCF